MTASQYEILANAFRPGSEITDPRQFAGRQEQIRSLCEALHSVGECPLIYGDRGLGKTSLAWQALRIAQGDQELLHSLGLPTIGFTDDIYSGLYMSCSDTTGTTDSVLRRMLNTFQDLQADAVRNRDDLQLVERQDSSEITIKFFRTETTRKYEQRHTSGGQVSAPLEDQVLAHAESLGEIRGQRILVVIDEVDRVDNKLGLASFLRQASSEWLKFVLVGVADDFADLIDDYRSVARILVPVHVHPMSPAELDEILDKALQWLRSQGLEYDFDGGLRSEIVRRAAGYPWLVHLLGKYALLAAYYANSSIIDTNHLSRAIIRAAEDRLCQQYERTYSKAVGRSPTREMVLRALAQSANEEIVLASIAGTMESLGARRWRDHVRHLESDNAGTILAPSKVQDRLAVRFIDPLFRAYVSGVCRTIHPDAGTLHGGRPP